MSTIPHGWKMSQTKNEKWSLMKFLEGKTTTQISPEQIRANAQETWEKKL